MIKLRTTIVLYIIVIILVYLFLPWKGIFFIFITLLLFTHLVYSALSICSNLYVKSRCKGNNSEKKIALTFDDGPDAEITSEILGLLDQYNAKATFFCTGKSIEKNRELLKDIDKRGHAIGNHTYSHSYGKNMFSAKRLKDDIQNNQDLIYETIGKKVKLFRPPFGVTNPPIAKAIKNFNFIVIGWSLRSFDTIHKPEQVIQKVIKKVKPGDIILFHDNRLNTIEILKTVLEFLQSKNYGMVRVDELLNIAAYE
ncbi:MAG TPA: polysaccharide deacetylase family protein [Bacteroidales bacterium]|nr:polysaccharide deacetylase family protein [Bacteroidales bacterium]